MESFKIENLSFTYPARYDKALDNINFTVNQGEFVLLCGKSGCGKTTLLRTLINKIPDNISITANEETAELFSNHPNIIQREILQNRNDKNICISISINQISNSTRYFRNW